MKKCVDCNVGVVYTSKQGFLSKKECRCKTCFKIWLSKIITDKQPQINKTGYKPKSYIFPNGRIEMIQGYESYTINYLISSSIHPNDIKIKQSEKPKINYEFCGITHPYIPDAYISSSNTIVETKSSWTWKSNLDRNMAKIEGTTKSGYDIRVIIWKGNKKLISDILYQSDN